MRHDTPNLDLIGGSRLSRTVLYEQIRAGRLRTVTQGRRRYVPASAIEKYVALLEHEADEHGGAA